MEPSTSPRTAGPSVSGPIRVIIVDDSAVVRGLIAASLEKDPDIKVVATASNGRIAVDNIVSWDPDVVILDLEMPVMDGMTALPLLLAALPDVKIIVASALTERGAGVTLKALTAGASECMVKPQASSLRGADEFRRDLLTKVKALGRRKHHRLAASPTPARPAASTTPAAPIALRPLPAEPPLAIAIASSTGGPQALFTVCPVLRLLRQPIFITQHMPPTFTTLLADQLGKLTQRPTYEGVDGMRVANGSTYVAPGDHHMLIERADAEPIIRISKAAPENFCRPSADPMLRSLAAQFGRRLLCIVLTGMGQDGLEGCRVAVAAGASVIAQDEATSVVWGMPGAVANAGLCSAIRPLNEIGAFTAQLTGGNSR